MTSGVKDAVNSGIPLGALSPNENVLKEGSDPLLRKSHEAGSRACGCIGRAHQCLLPRASFREYSCIYGCRIGIPTACLVAFVAVVYFASVGIGYPIVRHMNEGSSLQAPDIWINAPIIGCLILLGFSVVAIGGLVGLTIGGAFCTNVAYNIKGHYEQWSSERLALLSSDVV